MSTVDNNHTAISRDAPATIAPEPQDVVAADRKAPEKLILDSKEKIEYYRTIMQELVLYKSHCDTMRDSNPRDVCKLFYVVSIPLFDLFSVKFVSWGKVTCHHTCTNDLKSQYLDPCMTRPCRLHG
ncbi:uncharacterized protein LOC144548916 isoform X1 [Carex rostrata]